MKFVIGLWLLLSLCACGSDDATPVTCPIGETLNPVTGECLRAQSNTNNSNNSNNQNSNNSNNEIDLGTDVGPDVEFDSGCVDGDGDGQLSVECGGLDCDDTMAVIYDGAVESCDPFDNDCDGDINEEIECSFFAHSADRLYRINPFALTLQDLGQTPMLFDIDTHPDGTLYGVTSTRLHRFDGVATWSELPQELGLSGADFANGMAIDNNGRVFITTKDTLSEVNLTTGRASSVGAIAPSSSSGDCVVNKGNQLFMTSDHTEPDSLVTLNGDTGESAVVGITGAENIWALTAAWGRMYGLTEDGRLIEIDEQTGTSIELHQFPNTEFFGAASTPSR